jgi:hypothetical protein
MLDARVYGVKPWYRAKCAFTLLVLVGLNIGECKGAKSWPEYPSGIRLVSNPKHVYIANLADESYISLGIDNIAERLGREPFMDGSKWKLKGFSGTNDGFWQLRWGVIRTSLSAESCDDGYIRCASAAVVLEDNREDHVAPEVSVRGYVNALNQNISAFRQQ